MKINQKKKNNKESFVRIKMYNNIRFKDCQSEV